MLLKEPEIDWSADGGETPEHLDGNIKFSDIVFSYPARPDIQVWHQILCIMLSRSMSFSYIQILSGIDMEMKKGQTVALVGPSGCGKSTIIQLIQRFYNPFAGQVLNCPS